MTRDEAKGIFPEHLAGKINLIREYKDWIKNNGKYIPLNKYLPGQEGWTAREIEESKKYIGILPQLRK